MTELIHQRHARMDSAPSHSLVHDRDAQADEVLLRRYRESRGADVFTEMVRRHHPMVLRTCLRLAGNVHDAEDAAQSVFLVLAQRPEMVRHSLAGCLHDLARAAVSELFRSRRRRSQREELAARISFLVGRLRQGLQPMEHHELREELDAALSHLSDPLRQAVILRYLEGHSQEEAARCAGCTQVTMGWRSMKGLQRLRSVLEQRGVTLSSAALLALLNTEAEAAGALTLRGAVTTAATATSSQLAATLLRRTAKDQLMRKATLVALLATVSVGLGAGVLFTNNRQDGVALPTGPGLAGAADDGNLRLGVFERSLDIGGPARAGEARLTDGTYTVQGGGSHIYGKADQFRFVFRPWTGDGEIVARVTSDPDQEARQVAAGVMFRESLTADSPHVAVLVTAAGRCDVKFRSPDNADSACFLGEDERPGKLWVHLVRRGNQFTASTRTDGEKEWRPLKELALPMSRSLYVGLAVTAHDDAQLATATFDGVAVRDSP